jgi:hypothetical protein
MSNARREITQEKTDHAFYYLINMRSSAFVGLIIGQFCACLLPLA